MVSKTCYLKLWSCFMSVAVAKICILRHGNDPVVLLGLCVLQLISSSQVLCAGLLHMGWSAIIGREARPSNYVCVRRAALVSAGENKTQTPFWQKGKKSIHSHMLLCLRRYSPPTPHPHCFSMWSMTLLLGWLLSG